MEKSGLNYYVTLGILLVTAAVVLVIGYPRPLAGDAAAVTPLPGTLGPWQSTKDITYDDSVIQMLGTRNVVGKRYGNKDNRQIEIVVVRAVNNRSAFHPPEYCMTGGGSEIIDRRIMSFPAAGGTFSANEMLFKTGEGGKLLVLNWYAAGSLMTPDFFRQQWHLFLDQIRSSQSRGMVVNMYINVENEDIPAARSLGADFLHYLVPYLKQPITSSDN